jgi:TonB-linked SusC/RagA family outer membrane protein
MKQTFKMVFSVLLFVMSLTAFAQNTTITGKVVDKDGLGVIGLNVVEKGTKHAVLTDIDGSYKIQVPKGAVLQFSYIGMKTQEKTVGSATAINITMLEDNSTLNEVVVVGYGTQKKSHLTGAVATLDAESVKDLPVSNLSEALRGLVPGVSVNNANGSSRPGGTANITIRQNVTFSTLGVSSDSPLIVIDDMVQVDPVNGGPSQEAFNRLDPSDIESITVLKDGSAAIYGARASQGAIVVKTKRGKVGKTKFSYYSQFAVNDAISHIKTMNAYEHGVWKNRFLNSTSDSNTAHYFSADELEAMKDLDYDWLKKAWKAATQQRHVLNMSGGTEKATYYAGINYFTQGANLGEQDYNRWNFRTGVNVKMSDNLDFSGTLSVSTFDLQKSFTKAASTISDGSFGAIADSEQADYALLLHMPKYVPWQATYNGNTYWTSPFNRSDRNMGSANSRNVAGWNYFAALDAGKQTENQFSYTMNMSLNYKVPFIKGMSIKGSYARTESNSAVEQMQLPYDLLQIGNYETAGNHLLNAGSTYSVVKNTQSSRVYYNTDTNKMTQANLFASYARTFGDHAVDAMTGIERSESLYFSNRMAYEGTDIDYIGTSETAGTMNTGNSYAHRGEGGTLSYLGRLNYSYKDKYLAQFIFRSDASTKFAPENYWGFFPGAQFGWVISKEKWFSDNVSWVDNLKLRYSIAKTGKDNISAWRWSTLYDIITDKGYQFGTSGGTLSNGISPRATANPDVKWDTTIKNNYGIDLAVFNNRLQISADYYFDKTTDALVSLAGQAGVPISVGGAFAELNYAAVNTWGTEFSLNWHDKIKGDFSYNVGVNFGFSNNEIKQYPEAADRDPSFNDRRVGNSLYTPVWGFKVWKGTSTGDGILRTDEDITNYWNYLTEHATAFGGTPSYFGGNMATIFKGMLAYQDVASTYNTATGKRGAADGKIVANEDYQKLVNQNRTYGFTTNLGFKYSNLTFKTQIATSWGGFNTIDKIKQGTSSTHGDWAHEIFWTDMYDATDNPNGKYPNLGQQGNHIFDPSDFWQVSNFRCVVRNLTVGYDIPKEVLKTIKLDGLSFGISGQNLWDLYNPYPKKYRNMYDDSTTKYPTLRTWSLNLNVSF